MENREKDEQDSDEFNNPYLNKDNVPELEKIDKNKIIFCDKKEYDIKEYLEKINDFSNDFLGDDIYNYCGNCNNNKNKFFCIVCHKKYM